MTLTRKEFEELVVSALRRLPKFFKKKMKNVDVVVEDRASRDLLSEMGLQSPFELLGLYQGVPFRPKRVLLWECPSGQDHTLPDPDRVDVSNEGGDRRESQRGCDP